MRQAEPKPPRDYDGLKDLLLSRRDELPRRLVQVAAFALENPDEIAFGTVASVAAQADVQPSTLIRFAQTIGYAGFTDLQEVFRAQLKSRWPDYRERLPRLGTRPTSKRSRRRPPRRLRRERHRLDRAPPQQRQRRRHRPRPPRSSPPPTRSISSACAAPSRSPPTSPTRSASSASAPCSSTRSAALAPGTARRRRRQRRAGRGELHALHADHGRADAARPPSAKVPVIAITDSPFSPLAPSATRPVRDRRGRLFRLPLAVGDALPRHGARRRHRRAAREPTARTGPSPACRSCAPRSRRRRGAAPSGRHGRTATAACRSRPRR